MVRIHLDPPTVNCDGKERGGISSAGRAPALQAGGRRFDPVILHQRLGGRRAARPLSQEHPEGT